MAKKPRYPAGRTPPVTPKPVPVPEEPDDGPILNARQQAAIEALLVEPTISQAAEKAGLSRHWVQLQLSQNPTFRAAYREARLQALQHGIAMVTRYTPLAVQTLAKVASDEKAPYATRVAASAQEQGDDGHRRAAARGQLGAGRGDVGAHELQKGQRDLGRGPAGLRRAAAKARRHRFEGQGPVRIARAMGEQQDASAGHVGGLGWVH